MKKSIGKVVSMVLAAAMITSSFTATLSVSAASRETGNMTNDGEDTFKFTSYDHKAFVGNLDTLIVKTEDGVSKGLTLDTNDRITDGADVSSVEFVGWSHVSGDKVVQTIATKDETSTSDTYSKPTTDADDKVSSLSKGDMVLRANASGKEKISITYETDATRDDKEVKVRGSVDITIYADKVGSLIIGKDNGTGRPDDIDNASVNDQVYKLALAQAAFKLDGSSDPTFAAKYVSPTKDIEITQWKSNNSFERIATSGDYLVADDTTVDFDAAKWATAGDEDVPFVLEVPTKYVPKADEKEKYASTGPATLKFKHEKDATAVASSKITDSVKVTVGKQWTAVAGAEINRKSGSTYIEVRGGGAGDWDSDGWSGKVNAGDVTKVNGYKIIATGNLKVLGGNLGDIKGGTDTWTFEMEDGSVGTVDFKGAVTISGGSTGTIKSVKKDISISNGTVSKIDAGDATLVTVEGGKVGDITAQMVNVDSLDEEIPTTVGNIVAKSTDSDTDVTVSIDSSSDTAVKVGNVKGKIIELHSSNITVGDIDNDYWDIDDGLTFVDFTGKTGNLKNVSNAGISVEGTSNVIVANKLVAGSIAVEEDAIITVSELTVGTLSGDGVLAVPAGKLFINDGADSITLKLTDLAVGATAFQAYAGSVRVDDMKLLGFDVDVKSVNSDVEKFVVKGVTFAGLNFDKAESSVAKGSEVKVSLANYPAGTVLPKGAQIEWSILADDDYITMAVDATGTSATVKVVDFNADRADSNKATVTATVLDENGYEYEDANYAAATFIVTGIEKPASIVTIDTKTVKVGTAGVYQFIAKSSTDAVMTAASSNPQVATVALYDSKDARGYKFQVNGVAEGTATITVTDANNATSTMEVTVVKSNGTLKADTTTLKMAPGAIYDVKYTVTGSTAKPVVTCNGNVARISDLGNGKYRITAVNPGNAWVVATVGNARVTVNVNVAAGQALSGVVGNNVSNL